MGISFPFPFHYLPYIQPFSSRGPKAAYDIEIVNIKIKTIVTKILKQLNCCHIKNWYKTVLDNFKNKYFLKRVYNPFFLSPFHM